MKNNWPRKKFGEFLRPNSRPYKLGSSEDANLVGMRLYGTGPFHRELKPAMQIAKKSHFVIRVGDVIYNKLFAWKGTFGIVPQALDGMFVSDKFPTYELDRTTVDEQWLRWYFRYPPLWDEAQAMSTGSAALSKLTLNPPKFLLLTMPLPPLAEQQRIVARIEEMATRIKEASKLRVEVENETKVFFAKALTKAFEPYRASMRSIGDVFRVTTGGTPSRSNPAFWGGDIRWVSSGEVNFRSIEDTAEKITQDGVEGSNAKVNPPGTVLLAMIGQGKTRGQCATLNCYAATNQNVAAIHAYKTPHSPEYVYWWLYSQYQQSRAVETGTAQPALSGERVKQIPIPIPSSDEQRRTVSALNDLHKRVVALKELQAQTSIELDALMPSILDKAFRGEL